MSIYSEEHNLFLKKTKKRKRLILLSQLSIVVGFLVIWQSLASFGVINTFMTSSPLEVLNTTIGLAQTNQLFGHIWITVYETMISFCIALSLGIVIATILWWFPFLAKVFDPYLTILNSLPKVALGPLIIIWVGASINSIIFMALMISAIITIINIYNGFLMVDPDHMKLMHSFKATKRQIFFQLVLPSNLGNIINSLKINTSMSLIGTVIG